MSMFRKNRSGVRNAGDASELRPDDALVTDESRFVPEIPRRPIDLPGAPLARPFEDTAHEIAPERQNSLTVSYGISLSGNIDACDCLIVEGTVEADFTTGQTLEVSETGTFRGTVQVEEAQIAGLFAGAIVVNDSLKIRSTGRIEGEIRCRHIEVQHGGEIEGSVQVLPDLPADNA